MNKATPVLPVCCCLAFNIHDGQKMALIIEETMCFYYTGWFIKNRKFGNCGNTIHEMAIDANMPGPNVDSFEHTGCESWNYGFNFLSSRCFDIHILLKFCVRFSV